MKGRGKPKGKVRRVVLGTGWLWSPEHFCVEHHVKPTLHGAVYDVFLSNDKTMMQGRLVRLVLEVLPSRARKGGDRGK